MGNDSFRYRGIQRSIRKYPVALQEVIFAIPFCRVIAWRNGSNDT